jgi:MFS family permease
VAEVATLPRRPIAGLFTYETALLVMLGITFGVVFIDRNAMTILGPLIQKEFGLSNTVYGLLAGVLSISWGISAWFVGNLSDRTGRRKPFLIAATLLFSATTVASGLASGFVVLLVARLAMGLAEGPVHPLSQSLIAQASSEHRRGINAGIMQATITSLIGLILAPPLLAKVAGYYGWRDAFFVAAVPGLVMAIVLALFVREKRTATGVASHRSALPQLSILRTRNVALCMGIALCEVSWMVIAWAFLPRYFTDVRHFSYETMSWLISALGVSSAIFGLVLPWLSDRIGRKPVVVLFSALTLVMPFGVAFAPGGWEVTAVLLLIGWSASGTFPIFMATIPAESVPAASLGAAIGVVGGIAEIIGGFFGPQLAGVLADHWGLGAPLVLMGVLAVIATLLAAGLIETHPRRKAAA